MKIQIKLTKEEKKLFKEINMRSALGNPMFDDGRLFAFFDFDGLGGGYVFGKKFLKELDKAINEAGK